MDRRNALKKTGILAGAAVVIPSMFSLLQACKTENRLTWKPEFLTDEEARTISTLVDMIIPSTDTPGALDVKTDIFIDKVIAKTYDHDGQQNMRSQIAEFNRNCKDNYGDVFINLNEEKRVEVLKASEKSSGKFSPGVWGTAVGDQEPITFYRSMKSMAIWAYTTSEEIGKKVLNYDPIPGTYEPCKPVSEVGNRWSLG
ncbi:MAG: gluconate 2-dehydrogenase subunit 3 family protein [Flavobacteriaceae bacterium]